MLLQYVATSKELEAVHGVLDVEEQALLGVPKPSGVSPVFH
jgi:hypothetical protein